MSQKESEKRKKKRKKRYKFSDKIHPFSAILSVGGAIIAFVILIILCIKASQIKEGASLIYGAFGMIAMLISLLGLLAAILCFKRKEIHYFFPLVGTITNGILSLIFIIIYIMGM